MKKSNIIKWVFWLPLLAVIIAGYFFIGKKAENKHLSFIPSNVKAVIILDSKVLTQAYYDLLKFNPTKLDEVMPPGDGEPIFPTDLPGIVPLEKVSFYTYQDKETKGSQFFKCFIATLSDNSSFLKQMNGLKEKAITKEIDGGKIHHFKDYNKLVLIKDNIGVVIDPINPGFKMKMSIGERHFDAVFSKDKKSLLDESSSFAKTITQENHMNIWSSNGEGIMKGFGGSMIGINKLFNSQVISINLMEKSIETDVRLYINDKDYIIENGCENTELQNPEMMRLNMSINPEKFDDYFRKLIPSEKYYLADGWTGKICSSIIGYREKPVYQIIPDTLINKHTLDTIYTTDTTEVSRLLNLPHFVMAIEINNKSELLKIIENDTSLLELEGNRYLNVPNLIDEKMFFKIEGDNLLISSVPIKFDYHPNYTTFGFRVNIADLINNYPPKDMLQAMVIPTITKFEFKSFEMHYNKMNEDNIELHGHLIMGDENIHNLLKIVPLVFNMGANF